MSMFFITFIQDAIPFIIYFLVITLVLILVLLIYFLIIKFKKSKKIGKYYFNNAQYLYIFKLNSHKVLSYNLKDIKEKAECTINEFFEMIRKQDRQEFEDYLDILLRPNKEVDYSSREVVKLTIISDRKERKYHRLLLLAKNVDKEKGVITFEGLHLFNIPLTDSKQKKKIKPTFYHITDIVKLYEDGFFFRGSFYTIRFRKKEGKESYFNFYQLRIFLLDYLYSEFGSENIYYFFKDDKEFEIDILDSSFLSFYNLEERIEKLKKTINQAFEENSYSEFYHFTIAGTLVSELYHEFNKSYDILKKRIEDNFEHGRDISIYKKEEKTLDDKSWVLKTEVIKAIRSQAIECQYRPVLSLEDHKITNFGYLTDFKVTTQAFSSIDELKKASKQNNNFKEIFALCSKKAIPFYLQNRESFYSKLFIRLDFNELSVATKNIPFIQNISEAQLVFLFTLNDCLDEDEEDLIAAFKNAQLKGYEVALLIQKENFNAIKDRPLFRLIDLFLVDLQLEEGVKSDSKSFINAHALLERLVIFNKPLVAINCKTFNEIELLHEAGVTIFSSDAISSFSTMITPLDKKVVRKLNGMMKN